MSFTSGAGGFLGGFNNSFFPGMRENDQMELQRARDARQQSIVDQQQQQIQRSLQTEAANRALAANPALLQQITAEVPQGYLNQDFQNVKDNASPGFMMLMRNYRTPEQEAQTALGLFANQEALKRALALPPGKAGELTSILGRKPTIEELQSYAKSGATNVGVNIGGEKKFSEKTAEFDAGRFNEIKSAAVNTTDVLSNIQAAKSILASGKLETGALAPAKARIAAISQGLGIDPGVLGLENADTAQAFQGVVMKNLLQELVKQKGPQTEGDAQRAMKTFAQLGNTPEANVFLLDYGEALALRTQERANYITKRMEELGGESKANFSKAEQDWGSRVASVALFKSNPQTGIPITYYNFIKAAKAGGIDELTATKEWLKGD